jgi:hypothetical protein
LVIASEHHNWLPHDDDPLRGITSYMESSIPAILLTKIQDSFGDKIPIITNAMKPEGDHSQYEEEVADPLTDVVMSNLLRMPMDLVYYTNLLISLHIARPQQPLKGITEAMQPEGTFSQSEIEVTDPIVTDILLRMPLDFSY